MLGKITILQTCSYTFSHKAEILITQKVLKKQEHFFSIDIFVVYEINKFCINYNITMLSDCPFSDFVILSLEHV